MRHLSVGFTLLLAAGMMRPAPARDQGDGGTPTVAEALTWLQGLKENVAKKSAEAFAKLTVEDLKTLKEIFIGGHRQSDNKHVNLPAADFRYLTALTSLEKLNLVENEGTNDEALAHIGKLTKLTDLNMGDAKITDAGLQHLVNLKELRRLDVGWTKDVGDAGLDTIVKFAKLEFLGLGNCKVTDAGLVKLQALPALKELNLAATGITDEGFKNLAAIKTLTKVQINKKNKVTPAGIAELKKALPGCEVVNK